MSDENDYKLVKNEKGPLQRFKNQNIVLKKHGDKGLSIYKAITGKRTLKELKRDLALDPDFFDQVMSFMKDNDLVSLIPLSSDLSTAASPSELPDSSPPPEKPRLKSKKSLPLETSPIAPEPQLIEPSPSVGDSDISIEPQPLPPSASSGTKKKSEPLPEIPLPPAADVPIEIEPISPEIDSSSSPLPEPPPKKPSRSKADDFFDSDQPKSPSYSESSSSAPSEPEISPYSDSSPSSSSSGLSAVEKIIFDKYGDLGIKVYALIDGQRTAEQIMRQTGLTESKLVEILDFLDEQGIIKLDYPKNNPPASPGVPPSSTNPFSGSLGQAYSAPTQPPSPTQKSSESGFNPMIDSSVSSDDNTPVPSPLETPVKAPTDIVRSVQMKAKILLKYGERGTKIVDLIDSKNDVIDICLKMDLSLPALYEILNLLFENGMVINKPMARTDVKKKYGEDGYAVYKKYGKEGLLLYELVGKDMDIKQMADRISKDKSKIVEMFVFIHQVLGIELPIDKDALSKRLGI
ncbi:hypothetical protein HY990_04710 [Candidatus Micrarchaeota archaeon]|nr:hypothetical protein [Candidatus Micrarchaeota archaeon]